MNHLPADLCKSLSEIIKLVAIVNIFFHAACCSIVIKLFFLFCPEALKPDVGLSKLATMANTSGIWTMKCILIIERDCLVIHEKGTGVSLNIKKGKIKINQFYFSF